MGKSRSATIILAYLLRKAHHQAQSTSIVPASSSPTTASLSSQVSNLNISPKENATYAFPHTVTSALLLLRQARPIVEPNEGFMKQLELYVDMGCPRDIEGDVRYQRWVYGLEVEEAVACGRAPDRVRFEDEVDESREQESEDKEVELRCRKCR
jgi:hypothetical protein